jgi:putative tricarboxylic transport membrane protein
MTMQRIHQTAGIVLLALAVMLMWQSWSLEYYTKLGPGPGFFPFWLGVALAGLVLIWLAQVSMRSGRPKEDAFLPDRSGRLRILAILVALGAMAFFVDVLGFQIAMFIFLGFLLRVLGRQTWWVTAVTTLAGSVGVYHVFGRYLDVQLPASSITFLAKLGL